MAPALPISHAISSGVWLPSRVVAFTLAPAATSIRIKSTSPCRAAQCSAVMPSPCAAFTSSPLVRSARTAARSPAIAASATRLPSVPAWSRADSASAKIVVKRREGMVLKF